MRRIQNSSLIGIKNPWRRPPQMLQPTIHQNNARSTSPEKKILQDESVLLPIKPEDSEQLDIGSRVDKGKSAILQSPNRNRPAAVKPLGSHKHSNLQDLSSTINATADTVQQREDQPSSSRSINSSRPWGDPIKLYRNVEGKKQNINTVYGLSQRRNRLPEINELKVEHTAKQDERSVGGQQMNEAVSSPRKPDKHNGDGQTSWAGKQIRKLLGRGSEDDLKASKEAIQTVDAKRNVLQRNKFAESVKRLLESNTITYLYSFIIILSIFGDDVRRLTLMKQYDLAMDSLLIVIMTLFLLEIAHTMYMRCKEYVFGGAEFFLDMLATLSILFDIAMFSETYIAPLNK